MHLGAIPTPDAFGTVVVPKTNLTFLTFQAIKLDDGGNYQSQGLALIELSGCKQWRYRTPNNTDATECELSLESLAECQTYEVHQSSWAAEHASDDGESKLRHIVITFFGEMDGVCNGGQNFEFLAEEIELQIVNGANYKNVVDYMSFLDATAV